jgi:hypothetical protein
MSDSEQAGLQRHHEGFLVVMEQLGELDMLGFFHRKEQAVEQAEKEAGRQRTVFVLPVAYAVLR